MTRDKERRQVRRHEAVDEHGVVSMQVRPGHHGRLINIGAGGALVETPHRLLPGTSVDLVMDRRHVRASVRGRVLRCAVVRIHPTVCYRGAVHFDRSLPWFVEHDELEVAAQQLT